MDHVRRAGTDAPIVVHCSAGVGRTGCFMASAGCCTPHAGCDPAPRAPFTGCGVAVGQGFRGQGAWAWGAVCGAVCCHAGRSVFVLICKRGLPRVLVLVLVLACSPGAAGCCWVLQAIWAGLRQIEAMAVRGLQMKVDPARLLAQIRKDRGHSVQTAEQFGFIIRTLAHLMYVLPLPLPPLAVAVGGRRVGRCCRLLPRRRRPT